MVENDKASTRFCEKITLRDFLPILTLALGYFYGVSSSARETISLQNTVPYSPALPRAVPACPLVCPTGPAGPQSIEQHQLEEIQGPDEIMPIVTKDVGTLKLKGWNRKIPEAYARVEDLYEKKSCECSWGGKFIFTELANQTHLPVHKKDLELWKRDNYFEQKKPPPTFAKSHLPVSYITSGYEIDPTESVKLQIFVAGDPDIFVTGNFSSNFGEISWPETGKTTVGRMNDALEVFAVYTPTTYDARKLVDIVTFTVTGELEFTIQFPVTIRWNKLPVLTHRISDAIEDRVTILTKTFIRYPCLRRFLKTVETFYPGITVIIADDNNEEDFEKMESDVINIKQYRMPEKEGWFAGRALGVSQVRTQFFVWCDDDFQFNNETDLSYMVHVAETSGFDIIGGALNKHERSGWGKADFFNLRRSETGFCFNRQSYKGLVLPGFEDECFIVDVMDNFFLGRTVTAGKIRFDPEFDNKGHREYFLDARGHLRMAWCKKAMIVHINNCTPKTSWDKYHFGRSGLKYGNSTEYTKYLSELWYFRNDIKCSAEKP